MAGDTNINESEVQKMTLNDIQKNVAALGFEREIEADQSFICALNRALSVIYTERSVHKSYRFFKNSVLPKSHIPILVHESGKTVTIPINAKAYSFCCCGCAEVRITKKNGVTNKSLNSDRAIVRGFADEETIIEFFGDFRYTVYDLCSFDSITDPNESSIPLYSKNREYELKNLIGDFHSVLGLPKDEDGNAIEGSNICGSILKIPYGYSGEINLDYRVCAPTVSSDEADEDIGVPKEIEHLVPLLCAAYVWLDDDAEKAQYYMSLYREGMAAVKLYATSCLDTSYHDVLGWC